jgi:hypothetical protein
VRRAVLAAPFEPKLQNLKNAFNKGWPMANILIMNTIAALQL